MYFIDLVNVSSNNPILYILFAILFIVIIAILLLLYLQNKEMHNNLISSPKEELSNSSELSNNVSSVTNNQELQNISRELEQLPKEHSVDLTQYEMEQEKTAIISYDELVEQAQNKELSTINDSFMTNNDYRHEEEFLSELKQLKNNLN